MGRKMGDHTITEKTWRCGLVSMVLAALLGASTSAPAQTACLGDCDGSGAVTVDELVTMVNIALSSAALSACDSGDTDGSGDISIDEIIAAVNSAVSGCSAVATATATL